MTVSKDYWDSRYKKGYNSGGGSYGEALNKKLDWLKGLDITSIYELGCGDFNLGWRLLQWYPDVTYKGTDISEVIIERNKEIAPKHTFQVGSEVESADLILCVDVLLHVLEDSEVEELLQKLEKNWTKYLCITAYERDEDLKHHVRIRKFDYKRFGEPIIREVCEEDGQMYFYLFKK